MKEDILFKDIIIGNVSSIWINTKQYSRGCLQVVWKNVTAGEGGFWIEGSNDTVNWSPLSAPSPINGESGADLLQYSEIYCKFIRMVIEKSTIEGGILSAILVLKP